MRLLGSTRLVVVLVLWLCLPMMPLWAGPSGSRPNIIFFFVDDLGYGDLGCFWQDRGSSAAQRFDTPGLDRMAAEGVMLTHHYISAPVCVPSRASLMQGKHQGHADIRNSQFDNPLPANHTIGGVLQTAGYRTIHIGKNGVAGGEGSTDLSGTGAQNLAAHPLTRGWGRFFGYLFHADGHEHYPRNGTTNKGAYIYDDYLQITNASLDLYTTDAWTAFAKKEIIDEVNDGDDQPFFIYLAYDTPHSKMQRPAVAYPGEDLATSNHVYGLSGGIQWTNATDGAGNVRFASTADGTGSVDAYTHPQVSSEWTTSQKQHVGMIRRIDNSVADILQLLEDLNIHTNTLCLFSSDNGPHNEGNDPRSFESFASMEGIKRDMWEAGIRVPTIVRWPTHLPAATDNETNIAEIGYPCGIWDWLPTFADLAGVPAPNNADGVSLVPTLTGVGTQRDKGYLYLEFNSSGSTPNWAAFPNHRGENKGQMQCVRIGNYMGTRTGISSEHDSFQIYNVVTDPGQGTNLAASLPNLQAEMQYLAVAARRPNSGASRPYDDAYIPSSGSGGSNGLAYAVYEGNWPWVPQFADLTAATTGVASVADLSVRTRDDNIGIEFSGYIEAPENGDYTFYITSDSGGMLWVDEANVIDDDYNHDGTEQSGTIRLQQGLHPIHIAYVHTNGTHTLDLQYSGPSISKQAIPASAFYLTATGSVTEASPTNGYTWGGAGARGATEAWDSATNADPTHWGYSTAPLLNGPAITIPSGGINRSGAFTLSSTGRVTMTGGYLTTAGAGITAGSATLFDLQNGYVDAQFIKPMGSATIRIGGGLLELAGANEPFATASSGYLDFTEDTGIFSLPNKNGAYLAARLSDGDIRINGQTVAGTGSTNAVNGRYFDNDIDTAYVLVETDSYREQVMMGTNPLVYAMCDEGGNGGYLLDSSGRGKHGSSVVNATFGQAGTLSNGLAFAGNGSVALELFLNPSANDFSIELYLMTPEPIGADTQVVVGQKNGSGTGRSILTVNNTGELSSFLGGKGTPSGFTFASNRWYHVVMTVEEDGAADVIRYYVDGEATPSGGTANVEQADGAWVLGSHKDQGRQFVSGAIDEVAIYDRLLSPEEVYRHYRASPLASPLGTVFIVR